MLRIAVFPLSLWHIWDVRWTNPDYGMDYGYHTENRIWKCLLLNDPKTNENYVNLDKKSKMYNVSAISSE